MIKKICVRDTSNNPNMLYSTYTNLILLYMAFPYKLMTKQKKKDILYLYALYAASIIEKKGIKQICSTI